MKITIIDYDGDGNRYEDEEEIAPWNISGTWKMEKRYVLRMVGQKCPFYIKKEDYEKVLKYIKRREKHENTNRR